MSQSRSGCARGSSTPKIRRARCSLFASELPQKSEIVVPLHVECKTPLSLTDQPGAPYSQESAVFRFKQVYWVPQSVKMPEGDRLQPWGLRTFTIIATEDSIMRLTCGRKKSKYGILKSRQVRISKSPNDVTQVYFQPSTDVAMHL